MAEAATRRMTSDLQETTSLKNDMSTSDTRRDQMFPSLSPGESDRLRLGTIQRNRPGMFVLTSGTVGVTRHEGLGHVVPISSG